MLKSLVATLSLKRIPDDQIVKEIERQTNTTVSRSGLYNIRQQIKKDSYDWYKSMREGQHEYIHEFKERINEIMDLQKRCHELIESNKHNPQIQLSALAELHKLNITLSNYFEVIPTVINGITLPTAPDTATPEIQAQNQKNQNQVSTV